MAQQAFTLQHFIEGAIRDVKEQKADSHIVKVDEAWDQQCYEHVVAPGQACPCDPVIVYSDPGTGYKVYLHRGLDA